MLRASSHKPAVFVLLAAAAVLAPTAAPAQSATELRVRLVSSQGGLPVVGAQLRLEHDGSGALADSAGRALLRVSAPGVDTLLVTMLGYASRRLPLALHAGSNELTVVLEPEAVPADTLVVRAARYGGPQYRAFLARRARYGAAFFITGDEIRARGMHHFTEVVRGIPGARIENDDMGRSVLIFPRNAPRGRGGNCSPRFFLDGTPVTVLDLDGDFDIRRIAGVEAYQGVNIPPRFGGSQAICGVVAVWTF